MKSALFVLLATLACSTALAQQADKTPSLRRQTPTLDDMLTLQMPDYLQISPLGDKLVYTSAGQLWLVSVANPGLPKPVAKGALPTWSGDGRKLAYYSEGSGTRQLWVLDVATLRTEQITSLPGGIQPDARTRMSGWAGDHLRFNWSPDGKQLSFASQVEVSTRRQEEAPVIQQGDSKLGTPLVLTTKTPASWTLNGIFTSAFGPPVPQASSDKPAPLPPVMVNQLFVVDVYTKALRQLTTDEAVYFNPSWSPDNRRIICASSEGRNPWTGPINIYAIDVATGNKTPLTVGDGDKRLPRLSPDGKWIAFVGGKHFGVQSVFVIPSGGGQPLNLGSQIDRYITDFEWLSDSQSLALLTWDGVDRSLIRVGVADGHVTRLIGDQAADRRYLSVAQDGTLVWEQSDGAHHGAIVVRSQRGASPSVLVDPNPQIQSWQLGTQEVVRWKNSRGESLEGILIKPAGYQSGRQYPLIVDGYPSQPNGFKGTPMLGNQLWAAKGYAVFWPNARTPHTWMNAYRDESFAQAAKGPKGWDVTVDDVLSGVDELIRRGIANPERMGLYGFSNGGGVVNYLLTRTTRFKCAVSVAGVYPDWLLPTFLHTDTTIPTFEGGTSPWDDPEAYVKLSAIFHLKSVATPVLLADGDNDGDFLLGTIELFNGLRWLGKDVTFLRYPNQGHGFGGAALQDFFQREMSFFDEHLRPGMAADSSH